MLGIIPGKEACASAPDCAGTVWGVLDLGGGAMEGGGAGGLGSGPLFPLLTGSDAPMLKLVPAHITHTVSLWTPCMAYAWQQSILLCVDVLLLFDVIGVWQLAAEPER